MGKKLYIKTYGCQMNEYDSDKTVDILKEKKDVELTLDVAEADIILLNTCSIRDKAESKVFFPFYLVVIKIAVKKYFYKILIQQLIL